MSYESKAEHHRYCQGCYIELKESKLRQPLKIVLEFKIFNLLSYNLFILTIVLVIGKVNIILWVKGS